MLIDPDHPFFRPLWARILAVALPLAWAAFEARTGALGWAAIFAAAGLYALAELFLRRRKP